MRTRRVNVRAIDSAPAELRLHLGSAQATSFGHPTTSGHLFDNAMPIPESQVWTRTSPAEVPVCPASATRLWGRDGDARFKNGDRGGYRPEVPGSGPPTTVASRSSPALGSRRRDASHAAAARLPYGLSMTMVRARVVSSAPSQVTVARCPTFRSALTRRRLIRVLTAGHCLRRRASSSRGSHDEVRPR